jgi:hypothetical protein
MRCRFPSRGQRAIRPLDRQGCLRTAPYMIRLRFYNRLECFFELFRVSCMGSWASPYDLYHPSVEAFVVRKCIGFLGSKHDSKPVSTIVPYEVYYSAIG